MRNMARSARRSRTAFHKAINTLRPAVSSKTAPKPLRVFLQDGSNDLDNLHGNWPLASQQMDKALAFSKYDYKFVLGEGGHSGRHGGSIFPDTMRWLWRDWKTMAP